jgi:hypothetical protein
MSTRSNIGILNVDGSVEVVYCHSDGYLDYNGRVLLENYHTYDEAMELIENGAMSSLGECLDSCKFYNDEPSVCYSSLSEYTCSISDDIEYIYLFDVRGKYWLWSKNNHNIAFKRLTLNLVEKK